MVLKENTIKINKEQARRFLLNYHCLQPAHSIKDKSGILDYIRKVGCIQFDPVDVIGRNPDLALNARVKNYQIGDLDTMLYKDRSLLDGFDKVQSIYSSNDYPFFAKRRNHFQERFSNANPKVLEVIPAVLEIIQKNGPVCSLDLPYQEKVDWSWGPQKISKAALELLSTTGQVQIHHRVRSRRYFDLIENCLPQSILNKPDPFHSLDAYQDAHILRRIGGMGLARAGGTEHWLGMLGVKSPQRNAGIQRLISAGKITRVFIKGLEKQTYYIRSEYLDKLINSKSSKPSAVFVPPLDNFMWDRTRLEQIFDFKYIWEIYKPAVKRKYGYYVLPVIYGNKIIARFDSKADRKNNVLLMKNWWFEKDVRITKSMAGSIRKAVNDLARFLNVQSIEYDSIFKSVFSNYYGAISS